MLKLLLGTATVLGAGYIAKKYYAENQDRVDEKIEDGLISIYEWFDEKSVALAKYLDSLDVKSRAKVLRAITIVEDFGAQSPPGYIDHLGDGIYELRVKFSSNIFRGLYFHFHKSKYIITHGFTKKTQKTPSREITKSKEYRKDYLERNE